MESAINIRDLSLRLLGYYNEEGQEMSEETIYPQEAEELASLLDITFANIDDINQDEGFSDALKSGVFVMRDRESHLYAYWPQKKIARISNVSYNRDVITILPLEYKSWFTPGEGLVIYQKNSSNPNEVYPTLDFFQYLKRRDCIGKKVILSSEFLPEKSTISGELFSIGKDFITIKNAKAQEIIISNHMCLQILPINTVINESYSPVDDIMIPAMGTISDFNVSTGLGHVKSNSGEIYGLRVSELIDEKLKNGKPKGKSVVFSTRPEKHPNGNTMIQAIYVHAPGSVSELVELADRLNSNGSRKAAIEVLKHILDIDSDNEEVREKLDSLDEKEEQRPNFQKDEDSLQFDEGCRMLESGQYMEAIDIFDDLLSKEKKVKDCIPRIAGAYWSLYSKEDNDEEKEVYKTKLLEFIELNHNKVTDSQSLNLRLNYYHKLGLDDEYIKTIDLVLRDPDTDIFKRAKLLYYKSMMFSSLGDEKSALMFAKESIYLNPFNNKSEFLVFPELRNNTYSRPSSFVADGSLFSFLYQQSFDNDEVETAYEAAMNTDWHELDPLVLLKAALADKGNQHNQTFMAEYLSLQAHAFAKQGNMESAVYYWSQLFEKIQGAGWFVRENLAQMLKDVLMKDEAIDVYTLWDDKNSWEKILSETSKVDHDQWDLLSNSIRKNNQLLEMIGKKIASDKSLRGSFMEYIESLGIDYATDSYEGLLKKAAQKGGYGRIRQANINSKSKIKKGSGKWSSVYDIYYGLVEIKHIDIPFSGMSSLSQEPLNSFYKNVMPKLFSYINEKDQDARVLLGRDLQKDFEMRFKGFLDAPTMFTAEGLSFVMTSLKNLVANVEEKITETSAPELSIEILKDPIEMGNDEFYKLDLKIKNSKHSMDAKDIQIVFESFQMTECKIDKFRYYSLQAGDSRDFYILAKLDDKAVKNSSWEFCIKCKYLYQDKEYEKVFDSLQVHLKQNMPFVPIETNPYTSGTYLKPTDPTFVGRQKDIKEIINDVLHPQRTGAQVIVFGQKRCGKSTLVKAIQNRLEKEYPDKAWCVYMTLRVEGKKEEPYTEAKFYLSLLKAIEGELDGIKEGEKPIISIPSKQAMKSSDSPTSLFCETISAFKKSMAETKGWEHRRLVLIIDEFTVLYGSIKEGIATENILHHWKGIQESETTNFATIFVGHDITQTFFHEPYAINSMAIVEPHLLTYLEDQDAIELIERPTSIDGISRFSEDAVKEILEYTAGSPWYLQIFMQKMVDYINNFHVVTVTKLDVINVANRFVEKKIETFSTIKDFDNLINSGLASKYCKYQDEQFVNVLRIIAKHTDDSGWCEYGEITSDSSLIVDNSPEVIPNELDEILEDLESRKVIVRQTNDTYIRIRVKLFKEWLKRN